MTTTRVRIAAAVAALATAAAVSACGNSSRDERTDHEQTSTSAAAEGTAVHNADDVVFAQMMIPHHQQAVEIVTLTESNTDNQQLRTLANEILKEQTGEIQVFRGWLEQWGASEAPDHAGHGATMPGMIDAATMDRLKTLTGADFDQLWLQSMINHHQGAIEMAQAEIANGQNPDAVQVARSIVASQQAQIDQMKQMLKGS